MSTVDPRYILRTWFQSGHADCKVTAANLTYDSNDDEVDDANATFRAAYENQITTLQSEFTSRGTTLIFVIRDLGEDPPNNGGSGPIYRLVRTGIQPMLVSKAGLKPNAADALLWKAKKEVQRIVDVYYNNSDDKIPGRTIPESRRMVGGLIPCSTIEVLTKFYNFSVSTGTETVQRWTSIKIGYDATHYTEITDGIVDFVYQRVHSASRKDVANTVSAATMTQEHSHFPFQIVLDGDKRAAFFTQDVTGGGKPALDEDGDSNQIAYFYITAILRGPTGTSVTRVYEIKYGYILENSYEGDNRFVYSGDAGYISYTDT